MPKTLTQEQAKELSQKELLKALASPADYDPETNGILRTLAKMQDDEQTPPPSPSDKMNDDEEDDSQVPDAEEMMLGAKVSAAAHRAMAELKANIEANIGPVENTTVKEFFGGLQERLDGEVAAIEGMFSEEYKEYSPLGKMEDGDGDGEPNEEEMAKSWLAANAHASYGLAGSALGLEELAKTKGCPAPLRKELLRRAKVLRTMSTQAKSFAADEQSYKKKYDNLAALVKQKVGDAADSEEPENLPSKHS